MQCSRYIFAIATGSIHISAACRHEMGLLLHCITFELCERGLTYVPQGAKLHLMIHYIVIGGAGFACAFQAVRPNGRHMTENKRDRELFNRYNIGI